MPVASAVLVRALSEARAATAGASRWRDLRTRVLSALVIAPVGLICLWLGGVAWLLLLLAGGIGLGVEWRDMSRGGGCVRAMGTMTRAVFGLLYLGLPLFCLAWLRLRPGGLASVLFLVVLVSGCDIGAYGTGRLIGGPKLAPSISPGKTWSGAIGGLVTAILLGAIVALGFGLPARRLPELGVAALLLAVIAELGDLFESALKRRFGVKDSGRLIPGHGGLLDRFDGLLAASPVACLLALASGAGHHMSGGSGWW